MQNVLTNLGLTEFFSRQLTQAELQNSPLARIVEIQRTNVFVSDGLEDWAITLGGKWFQYPAQQRPTIGDWVVLDAKRERIERLLNRKSVFERVAAGSTDAIQLIAANIDILFIVTSCNDEFKESRLERYLALAQHAGVDPVVVLTKSDLAQNPTDYLERVLAISPDIPVEMVNGLDVQTLKKLSAWVGEGITIALVGSSGVGKSTIVNTLSGSTLTDTAAIREQDSKGRHTTSYRSLHRLAQGGMLLDVPGIRELKLPQQDTSFADVFADVDAIANECKFNNCAHDEEPDCAIRAAITDGTLDARRLANYQKLMQEESRHALSPAEQRSQNRQFSKTVKQHMALKRSPGAKRNRRS